MKNIFSKKAREEAKAQKQLVKAQASVRKPEEIQKEYHGLCAELGDKNYKMKVLENETEQIKQRLYALNQEFHRAAQVHKPAATTAPAVQVEAPAALKESPNEAVAV